MPGRLAHCAAAVAALLSFAALSSAQTAENVALVINENSAESVRIGEHYARVRALPADHILRIKTTTEETIERDAYVRTIEGPLAAAIRRGSLHDRVLYIVLTKGVPLKIAGPMGLKGTAASVDSELTLLYRRMTGATVAAIGYVDNPYYLGTREIAQAQRFTHRDHDIFLVTRLDGFTTDDVIAMIGRAQKPEARGVFVLDQRASEPGPRVGDDWMRQAADRLRLLGSPDRVLLEETPARATTREPVVGLYSWGGGDPEHRVRAVQYRFAPGAIAASLTSFDARTFKEPPASWQPSVSTNKADWFEGGSDTLTGDIIRAGITGVSGQVGEAFVLGTVRPEILFPAYAAGFNVAEAFYLASPLLSWQQVVIGDPLTTIAERTQLTRQDLEAEIDDSTLLPGYFGRRRLANARAAASAQSHDVVAAVVRAETLLARGDQKGAYASLLASSAKAPESATLLLMLANIEEQEAEYDAAIANYRKILELQPTNVVALNNLAYALGVRKHEPAEGLVFARKAAALAPRLGLVLDTLGWLEHLTGNHESAATVLAQAVALSPESVDVHLHNAVVASTLGRDADAEKHLAEALRIDPAAKDRPEVSQIRPKK